MMWDDWCVQNNGIKQLTVSRLRYNEALLLYTENAGQISSLFAACSQSLPPHLFTPLQVVTVPCIRNPVIGAEAGLVYACGQRPKEVTILYVSTTKTHSNNWMLIIVMPFYLVVGVDW